MLLHHLKAFKLNLLGRSRLHYRSGPTGFSFKNNLNILVVRRSQNGTL